MFYSVVSPFNRVKIRINKNITCLGSFKTVKILFKAKDGVKFA